MKLKVRTIKWYYSGFGYQSNNIFLDLCWTDNVYGCTNSDTHYMRIMECKIVGDP